MNSTVLGDEGWETHRHSGDLGQDGNYYNLSTIQLVSTSELP